MFNRSNNFSDKTDKIKEQYKKDKNLNKLEKRLNSLASKYSDVVGCSDYFLYIGNELIEKNDYDAGIIFIKTAAYCFDYILGNAVGLYLRMAEYHLNKGETDRGTEFLIKLCTETVENYEESIQEQDLTDIWLKFRHLVDGKVPASIPFNRAATPVPPQKCSKQIEDILRLSDDEFLSEFSEHLGEMSGSGECLNYLNKWERIAFYADELCREINSGGISHYLYYCGHHFDKVVEALESINATAAVDLMLQIKTKFPKCKIPKSLQTIQNTLDDMEENNIDFEKEEQSYYAVVEKDLLAKLISFVEQNNQHFR